MKRFIIFLLIGITFATVINIPADFSTIQEGIDASSDGDTVLVQPSTYYENINFNGHNITLGSMFIMTGDTSYISQTVINGNQSGSVVIFENGEDSTAILSGIRLTGGIGTTTFIDEPGDGGIFGGGVLIHTADPILDHLIIIGNGANKGGGTAVIYSNTIISNSIISDNFTYAGLNENQNGAGIFCYQSPIEIINCRIVNNSSGYSSGGINLRSSDSVILNSIIANNTAINSAAGINISNSSPTIINSLIYFNSSIIGAGILAWESSNPIIQNCTISYNTASNGSGMWIGTGSNPELRNTIFWANDLNQIYFQGTSAPNSLLVSYSDIEDGENSILTNNNGLVYWLEGNITSNPLFINPIYEDFHIQPDSPCIDIGDPHLPTDPDCSNSDMGALYFNNCEEITYDISTIIQLIPCIIGTEITQFCLCYDQNDDCFLDIRDIITIINYILNN
jgi:hypothetical protein